MGRRSILAGIAAVAVAAAMLLGGVASPQTAPPGAVAADGLTRAESEFAAARTTAGFRHLTRADREIAAVERSAGESVQTLALRAQIANYRHRFANGLALASAALTQDAQDVAALGARIDALFELGRYGIALRELDEIVELAPDAPVFLRVAQARQLLGRPAAAIGAAELAVEAAAGEPPLEATSRVHLAGLLANGGRIDRAEGELRRALGLRPAYPPALAGLADVAAARGERRSAVILYRRALARTRLATYAEGLAAAYLRSGNAAGASAAYALAERRSAAFARHGGADALGRALLDLDRDRNVRAALRLARQGRRDRPSIEGDHVLAWALYKNGRCGSARRHSIRALRFGTEDLDAIYHRGLIEGCLGNEAASRRFRVRVRMINRYYLADPPSSWRLGT